MSPCTTKVKNKLKWTWQFCKPKSGTKVSAVKPSTAQCNLAGGWLAFFFVCISRTVWEHTDEPAFKTFFQLMKQKDECHLFEASILCQFWVKLVAFQYLDWFFFKEALKHSNLNQFHFIAFTYEHADSQCLLTHMWDQSWYWRKRTRSRNLEFILAYLILLLSKCLSRHAKILAHVIFDSVFRSVKIDLK